MVRAKGLLAGIIVIFVLFPIAKYITLHSNVMDLGVFEHQIVVLAGGVWQAALTGHLQGYSLALASLMPAYISAGLPVGIGLVGIQALLLILPAFIFLRIAGIWVALAYVAYSPLWINAHFDFHYDHLAVPLLMGFYMGLRNNRPWRAFLFAALLVFVKEPFALQTAACGLLMLWIAIQNEIPAGANASLNTQRSIFNITASKYPFWLAGIALIILGSGYFYFSVNFVLPYFAPANWGVFTESGAFSWLGNGLGEIAGSIIIHPLAILEEIINTPGKLIYLFVVFSLLAFIPLLAPSYLIPALPLLAIAMLSRLPNYYDYNTHYTAGLIIPVMFAFIHGLPKAHALWMRVGRWVWRKVVSPRSDTGLHAEEHPHPSPEETTSHSTRLPKDRSQVAGYPPQAEEGTYARRVRGNAVGLEQSVRHEPAERQSGFDKLTTNRFRQFMLRRDSPERSQRAQALRQAQGERRKSTVLTTGDARLSKAFYVLLTLWILAGHMILSPSPISRLFWSGKVWSYSWRAYVPTEREAMIKAAMLKYIPADPSVSVTTQNTVNWYHLAHRKVYAPFPMGVVEPLAVMDWSNRTWAGFWHFVRTGQMQPAITHDRYADYVVLDLKRPYFLVDRGCEWIYGECRDKAMEKKFLGWVAYARRHYDALFEKEGFIILKRRIISNSLNKGHNNDGRSIDIN